MSLTNTTPLSAALSARKASRTLARLSISARNEGLSAIHAALSDPQNKEDILAANARDLAAAQDAADNGILSASLVKRLDLGANEGKKWEDMVQGLDDVRRLEDPLGKIDSKTLLDDGLVLRRTSCPIGVLLIIFEARPEVIANISALAIKSGNAAILKGGKESIDTFKAISTVISKALSSTKVPNDCLQLVTTRDVIEPLLQLDQHIDLVIPRGSNELVRSIKSKTQIPVLGHADGLCTVYLCSDCPPELAVKVLIDAKTTYPAACNSVETLLVDEDALNGVFGDIVRALLDKGVSLRCDSTSMQSPALSVYAADSTTDRKATLVQKANDKDYDTEFLDLTLAVKTIPRSNSAEEAVELAIDHINLHSSHHTDAILTASADIAATFQAGIDSASVFWNTSTRMADGQRYGFGTEVGISTSKIHARGPVGLKGLTIYKWLLDGSGQVAAEYGAGGKSWKHLSID